MRTCRWLAASFAGLTCGAISPRTPKVSLPRRSSASMASRSVSASSGPGRSSSTRAIGRKLKLAIRRCQREFKPLVARYASKRTRNKYCRGMARNLLKAWPALWTFANHNGVEPTNNHAERSLRSAVIYRKLSLGSQSEDGERRIERLLSAHTTCRLQSRSLFIYLTEALSAHARGDPIPLLT
jgi:Transposase IS66 family